MRVSLKSDYGLRALLDLAERTGQGPVRCETIAARQEIPPVVPRISSCRSCGKPVS